MGHMSQMTDIIKARVEPEIKAALEELQKAEREPEAYFVRAAVRQYLASRKSCAVSKVVPNKPEG